MVSTQVVGISAKQGERDRHSTLNGIEQEVDSSDKSNEKSPLLINDSTTKISTKDRLRHARRLLYVSHLFSQFSENAWQFCLILFLAAFADYDSIILVSTYGLVSGLAVCMTGARAGRFIDGENRLFVAQRFIWTENVSVLIATLFCYVLLARSSSDDPQIYLAKLDGPFYWIRSRLDGVPLDPLSVVMLIGIHVLGSIARILDRGFVVAIERDWIVVMSRMASPSYDARSTETNVHVPDAEGRTWLSDTNVAMKQIDLSCKVAAPALSGFFIAAFDDGTHPNHGGDLSGAALLVGLVNVAALVVEYVCTARIYALIPDLANKAPSRMTSKGSDKADEEAATEASSAEQEEVSQPTSWGCGICTLPDGLQVYLNQSISLGGIGLALLYLNALTFGGIMTAYLLWRGMHLETVGVWRGISCAVGLMGTFAYSYSVRYLSVAATGMWSIVFQFLCLTLSYISLFVGDYTTSLSMLIGGACLSRVGLWVFDISVTQLMQEYIPSDVRGVVGGVQQSLNAFFGLLMYVLGILIPDPEKFAVYVASGYASVGIAMILYAVGVYAKREKLVPQ